MIFNESFSDNSDMNLLSGTGACSIDSIRLQCGLTDEECGKCSELVSQSHIHLLKYSIDFLLTFSGQGTHSTANLVLMIVIMIMIIVQILLEIFQFYTQGLWYLKDWTNYVDTALYITSLFFIVSALLPCACPAHWQWQFGCIAVFLAWIDLLVFLRMGPGGKALFYVLCCYIVLDDSDFRMN